MLKIKVSFFFFNSFIQQLKSVTSEDFDSVETVNAEVYSKNFISVELKVCWDLLSASSTTKQLLDYG